MNIPIRIKLQIKYLFTRARCSIAPTSTNHKRCIYIFLAANYGNLGDVAITYAQIRYLKNEYPDCEIIEIPISQTLPCVKVICKSIKPEDIVTLLGGGNMGDMYDDIEWLRQLVIRKFPSNRVISFPQTIDFSTTDFGKHRLRTLIDTYKKHHNLELLFREESSFHKCLQYLPNISIKLLPDIVMTLDKFDATTPRQGVLICLREDQESSLPSDVRERLLTRLSADFGEINYTDTHVGDVRITEPQRELYLNAIWSKYSSHRLVVTDRLHGMIFAFITGTPALVFDNSNKKVSGCYRWIEKCGYIKLITSINEALPYPPLPSRKDFKDTHIHILTQFHDLLK